MNENIFDKLDFGPFRSLLDNDDITDISYDNNGQIWIRSLTQGSMRVEVEGATPEFVEKLAFQCSNVMGTTFNNAKPFLDAESAELRMNFVHQSIATNGIALVIRKTPAKIRLQKEKLIEEDYFTPAIHDFLIKCVEGHCNIMVAGETGSGKTEFVKYLASHTKTNEKIITIEDTLELHLDKIFPQRDIVAMKTNNVASYSDVLVTCMRQNPKWILLSEVRSAEAVSAVRNSISSGHNILSTIHADKASAIPYRLYSLMETDLDVHQFLTTIYRYIQLGVHIKAFYSKQYGKFHRELDEVAEFYVDDNNEPQSRIIYQKIFGKPMMCRPSDHLVEYLANQNIEVEDIIKGLPKDLPLKENLLDEKLNEEDAVDEGQDDSVVADSGDSDGGSSSEVKVDAPSENTNEEASSTDVAIPPTSSELIPNENSGGEVSVGPPELPTDQATPAVLPTNPTELATAQVVENTTPVALPDANVEASSPSVAVIPPTVEATAPSPVVESTITPTIQPQEPSADSVPVSFNGQPQTVPVFENGGVNVQMASIPVVQPTVSQQVPVQPAVPVSNTVLPPNAVMQQPMIAKLGE